ncbi:MAG: T9SS type A sorting domain-containing protein [Cytophagales bacterium]
MIILASFCINPNKATISVTDLNTSSPKLTSSAVAGNQWFFNDALISSSTGQTFTATEPGKYKVQVKADDCFSEFSLEQVLVVTGDIQKAEADVQLFPNPVTDWLTITLNDDGERKIITLFNSAGQQLAMQETASDVARFEVSDFSKGVYIAKVIIGNQMKVIRFVKK